MTYQVRVLGVADSHNRFYELVLLEIPFCYWGGFAVCTPFRVTLQAARDEDVLSPRRRERTLRTSDVNDQKQP